MSLTRCPKCARMIGTQGKDLYVCICPLRASGYAVFEDPFKMAAAPAPYSYPHQGTDKRVFGRVGAWICNKLSFDSPKLPALFVIYVWPRPGFKFYWRLWMLRAGWHYDYNAKAYIFGFAFKKASEQSL